MNILTALLTVLAPVSVFLFPGILLLTHDRARSPLLRWVLVAVSSVAVTTLLSLAAAFFGLPQLVVWLLIAAITATGLIRQRQQLRQLTNWYQLLVPPTIFCALLLLFSLPFLYVHDGLPTGDIQKSIIWANDIVHDHQLPDYSRSIADLNRDPVDFYTPGLHTLLAYIFTVSPSPTAASFFSIATALAVAGVAIAIGQLVFAGPSARLLPLTIGFLLLTNIRFLRYLREPGYHVQNSVGELFLFGSMLLCLLLLQRWSWPAAAGVAGILVALAFSHQFSLFIGAFALLPFAAALVVRFYQQPRSSIYIVTPAIAVGALVVLGSALGLHRKIPDIFTTTPHLVSFTPSAAEYFSLLGPVWLALGAAGLVVLIMRTIHSRRFHLAGIAAGASTLILLALSQAPHFFIDIPPVRALFYAVVPLSITGAYVATQCFARWRSSAATQLVPVVLLLTIIIGGGSTAARAYALSHSLRTNSTLLAEQQYLVEHLRSRPEAGGVVIDDYNRRSASWLVLAGRPMFTRIAADLAQQMAEAKQSPLRYQLYLNQLDFEKIFSLGSHPAAADLMKKHNIGWVTGITNSSAEGFAHNPQLTVDTQGGDIQLYKAGGTTLKVGCPSSVTSHESPVTRWLLRASTLVNDIGDNEDTFEHLPASVRGSRISDPLAEGSCTYRTAASRYIPLSFNAGDYVTALWDQDPDGKPDIDLEILVELARPASQTLSIRTVSNKTYILPASGPLRLPARDMAWDDKGMVTVILENMSQEPIHIDLIALGLAQVP